MRILAIANVVPLRDRSAVGVGGNPNTERDGDALRAGSVFIRC